MYFLHTPSLIGRLRSSDASGMCVQDIYRKHVSPRLQPHQSVVLVPGAFASHYNKKCSFECYDGFCLHDAIEYLQWALDDPRVAAITPYHWHTCPHCHATRVCVHANMAAHAHRTAFYASASLCSRPERDHRGWAAVWLAERDRRDWFELHTRHVAPHRSTDRQELRYAAHRAAAGRAGAGRAPIATLLSATLSRVQRLSGATWRQQVAGREEDAWMLDIPVEKLLKAAKVVADRAKREAHAQASSTPQHELQPMSTKTKAMQMVGRSSQEQLQALRGMPAARGRPQTAGAAKASGGGGGGGGVGQTAKNRAQQATKEKQKHSQLPPPSPSSSREDEVRDESGQGHVVMQRHVPRREVPVQTAAAVVPIAVPDHQAERGPGGDERAEELECADGVCVRRVAHGVGQGGIEQQAEEESIQVEEEQVEEEQVEEEQVEEEERTQVEEKEEELLEPEPDEPAEHTKVDPLALAHSEVYGT